MTIPFGERLSRLRRGRNLTLEQLAGEVGVSKSYIWALENRPAPRTSAKVMNALAKALGVTLPDLMGEAPPQVLGKNACLEDVLFFRDYMRMSREERASVRKMFELFRRRSASQDPLPR